MKNVIVVVSLTIMVLISTCIQLKAEEPGMLEKEWEEIKQEKTLFDEKEKKLLIFKELKSAFDNIKWDTIDLKSQESFKETFEDELKAKIKELKVKLQERLPGALADNFTKLSDLIPSKDLNDEDFLKKKEEAEGLYKIIGNNFSDNSLSNKIKTLIENELTNSEKIINKYFNSENKFLDTANPNLLGKRAEIKIIQKGFPDNEEKTEAKECYINKSLELRSLLLDKKFEYLEAEKNFIVDAVILKKTEEEQEKETALGRSGLSLGFGYGWLAGTDQVVQGVQIKYNFLHSIMANYAPYNPSKTPKNTLNFFRPNGLSAFSLWIGYGVTKIEDTSQPNSTTPPEANAPYLAGISVGFGRATSIEDGYHLPIVSVDYGQAFYNGVAIKDQKDWYLGVSLDLKAAKMLFEVLGKGFNY